MNKHFDLLVESELTFINGGSKEDHEFGELVGNAFVGAVTICLPKIPILSNYILGNVQDNVINWYLD